MVSGLSLAAAYTLFGASLIGGFAAFAQAKVASAFDMDPINWIWFAILGIIGISLLGYFDIPISAKILGVFLITELFIIFAFTIGVFIQGGNDGVSIDPVLPWNAFKGIAFGLGIFIAFWSWVGFEAAPNYAEESKDPHRIIPIAVYVSCIFVGCPLHPRVVGFRELVRARQRGVRRAHGGNDDRLRRRGGRRLPELQRRAGERAHRHLAGAADVGLHHHGRLRLCRGPEQRRAALHVRARPRGAAAQGVGPHPPEAQDPARGRPHAGRHRPRDHPHLQVRRPDRARRLLLARGPGRDLDHPRPGADLAVRLGVLPPPARQRAELLEDHRGGVDRVPRPGPGALPLLQVPELAGRRRRALRQGARSDRAVGRVRDRHHVARDHRRARSRGRTRSTPSSSAPPGPPSTSRPAGSSTRERSRNRSSEGRPHGAPPLSFRRRRARSAAADRAARPGSARRPAPRSRS